MAKIDDVAKLAGVSTATVSRTLRGLPLVSEQTRVRVVQAAATLGYEHLLALGHTRIAHISG